MPDPTRQPAHYEDLLGLPEHVVGEIVGGRLWISRLPAPRLSLTISACCADLIQRFQRPDNAPGGWWILRMVELHLGAFTGRSRPRDEVLVPDIAGWRRERLPRLPDVPGMELPPDWVCEVLSPSTARLDRLRKMPVYAKAGVPHVWLVDPVLRLVEVYRLLDSGLYALARTEGGEAPAAFEPFDAFELDVADWWTEEENAPASR